MVDIREYPETIKKINEILNSRGIVEVKNEIRDGKTNLVVVRIIRLVESKKPD